jgi:hypothetical protein
MGKSAVAGPFYGAKSLLWATYFAAGSSNGASTGAAAANEGYRCVVPNYEDWFVTEGAVNVSTHSSVAHCVTLYLKVEGGSTTGLPPRPWAPGGSGTTNAATILTLDQAGTSTTWSTWATAAVSPGEYEGTWCPAGSTLRWVSSGTSAPGGVNLQVRGFIRYADSTRAS